MSSVGVNSAAMNAERLELAKRVASRINMAKNLGPDAKGASQQAAEAILKGAGSQPIITVSYGAMYSYICITHSQRDAVQSKTIFRVEKNAIKLKIHITTRRYGTPFCKLHSNTITTAISKNC